MHRRSAITAALLSAMCFGTLAVFARLMYDRGAEPLQVLTWRFGLAAVLLGVYLVVRRPGALRVTRGDLGRYATIAVFGYGAASMCFFFALLYADASVVAILLYTYPAMIALVERIVRGVPLTPGRLTAIVLTFAGCALVVDPLGGAVSVEPLGIVLGLGAAAGYTTFSMLSDAWTRSRSRLTMMAYMFAFTTLLTGAAVLITGSRMAVGNWDPPTWLLLLGMVLIPTFAAILLYLQAMRSLGAAQAAIISTFEPVFTILLAAAFLGERLTSVQYVGAFLVLAGVFVAERFGRPAVEVQPV